MRERLVSAFVGLTVVVIALYGIPRAYFLADLVRTQEQARVERTADLVAVVMERRADRVPVTASLLDSLADDGERIAVTSDDGRDVSSAGPPAADGDVTAVRSVPSVGRVSVTRTASAVSAGIATAVTPLLVLGLLLLVLAALAGFLLARQLARPFQDLAQVARRLGAGRLPDGVPAYRVPEAREIGRALEDAGRQIDGLLRTERELAANASHELRTPVTALRLELEDLVLWPETPEVVGAELGRAVDQLDRLSGAIDGVLALAQGRRAGAEIDLDLDALVADTTTRLRDLDRLPVRHESVGRIPARMEPRGVVEAIEALVTAAAAGGGSHVVVTDAIRESHLEVRVAAPGWQGPSSGGGDALRWNDCGEIVAAVGGQLSWEHGTSPGAVLRLPRHRLAHDRETSP